MGGALLYMYKVPLWERLVLIRYLFGRSFVIHVQNTFMGGTVCHKVIFGRGFVIYVQNTFMGGTGCHKVLFWEGLCCTCTKYFMG